MYSLKDPNPLCRTLPLQICLYGTMLPWWFEPEWLVSSQHNKIEYWGILLNFLAMVVLLKTSPVAEPSFHSESRHESSLHLRSSFHLFLVKFQQTGKSKSSCHQLSHAQHVAQTIHPICHSSAARTTLSLFPSFLQLPIFWQIPNLPIPENPFPNCFIQSMEFSTDFPHWFVLADSLFWMGGGYLLWPWRPSRILDLWRIWSHDFESLPGPHRFSNISKSVSGVM